MTLIFKLLQGYY